MDIGAPMLDRPGAHLTPDAANRGRNEDRVSVDAENIGNGVQAIP